MLGSINVYSFSKSVDHTNNFLKLYDVVNLIIPPDSLNQKLRPRKERLCRFCNKRSGEVKFKKDAHLLPNFLGNKYLLADFECDECNTLFSKYENDFANWLGISRTIFETSGKQGVPSFKAADGKLSAKKVFLLNREGVTIETFDDQKPNLEINTETGRTEIRFKKASYVPLNMYKCLLKIAISVMSDRDSSMYKSTIDFLLKSKYEDWFMQNSKIVFYELPIEHSVPKPIVILFQKKDPSEKIPNHIVSLYYGAYIFSFPLFFSALDVKAGHYNDSEINLIYAPPILFSPIRRNASYHSSLIDLGYNQKIKGEEGFIRFDVPPHLFENLEAIDMKTGDPVEAQFNPSEIIGIYMAKNDKI